MAQHADDEPVLVGFESSRNITFHGRNEELGVTWGQWRQMSQNDRDYLMDEYLYNLVNVYIQDNEEEGEE